MGTDETETEPQDTAPTYAGDIISFCFPRVTPDHELYQILFPEMSFAKGCISHSYQSKHPRRLSAKTISPVM